MSKIGLIGGMTPESTILYYRELNRLASESLGKKHSCNVLIESVDFGVISKYQTEGCWDLLDDMMIEAAKNLEKGLASCILICANTMHLTIEAVKNAVNIPVVHIAEATSLEVKKHKINKVALLGTKYTMEKRFYADVLSSFDIETITPNKDDREIIHQVIYDELAFGVLKESSKAVYLRIINDLIIQGAEAIILGCTEIPMLIEQKDVSVPIFDTTKIHATTAYNLMKK